MLEEKASCDYEGCEEYAVTKRCREHSLFVEQVWVIYATDGGLGGAESSMTVCASEQSARDIMEDRIGDAEDEESRTHWREQLDAWSGQRDVTVGPWVIQVKTVEPEVRP